MTTIFCYCCKQHVTVADEEAFHASGHVKDKDTAKKRYGINISTLPRDSELGLKK